MRTRLSFRQRRDRTRGQSLVEFGLVLPLLLLIFAAAADFGRVFYGYVALENAVKEGAIYGARYPLCADSTAGCPDPDNVRWRVQEEAKTVRNPDGSKITPTAQCIGAGTGLPRASLTECLEGDTYLVSASYQINLITPILSSILGSSYTVRSDSTAVVFNEAFDPTAGAAPTKLVRAEEARNKSEIRAKCVQPDPTGSPDFYRSPCVDTTVAEATTLIQATFRPGDTIRYKVTVRNNGGTNLTSVTINDSQGWPAGCAARPTSMPINGTPYTCEYTRTAGSVTGSGDSSDFTNVLTVGALEILATSDGATVTIERPPADLVVRKFVSPYKEGADGDGSISGSATFGTIQSLSAFRDSGTADVWYKVIVTNQGGRTAANVEIVDSNGSLPFGQNSSSAVCDAAPANLAVGARFECRYRVTFGSDETRVNTVTATATNVTPDSNDDNSATVTVGSCSGGNKVVPSLMGLDKTAAQARWTSAGFTGALSTWSGSNGSVTVAQNQLALQCVAPTTTIAISKDPT
jgi:uncharacterized repeat protein (TIGR01451 family)